ncbi:CBS-domain-containing protein [Aspergillus uvarum CBS 121591]|uniref:CBS-domain-containing protein n=2 Tax=Aspergillus subgen. Circumdati TaxID=2720871 RepID=A0A319CKI2_9EURO|nr:CBS-domain-containing protein [Aspergillus uvarum CBS 121591]PYH75928.1 CBS-domain-containing protein [Aspergillus uvarum CBS 121591]
MTEDFPQRRRPVPTGRTSSTSGLPPSTTTASTTTPTTSTIDHPLFSSATTATATAIAFASPTATAPFPLSTTTTTTTNTTFRPRTRSRSQPYLPSSSLSIALLSSHPSSTLDHRPVRAHEGGFVHPASFLRPRGLSQPMPPAQPERAIDREERQGLRAIRNFLKVRTSYDVLPLSFRLIIFDTSLSVKESLNILIQNGRCIVSAPLWDSKASTFAGLLTTSDYINVIQYYFQNPAALNQIDQFRLDSLREVEKALGVAPPETISIDPERPLYEACRRMLESRARRIPLVTYDSQTDRSLVLSVVTQYRILKFVAVNVPDTQKLRKPLGEILLGSYQNVATASMDTPVIDVIHILVERSISSVPIVNSEGVVYNVFEAVDVITLIKGGVYDDLSLTVGEALKKRSPDFPGIYTCSLNDGLDTIFDTIRKSRVHRLVVVDENFRLKGVLTLSDILQYILLEGETDELS